MSGHFVVGAQGSKGVVQSSSCQRSWLSHCLDGACTTDCKYVYLGCVHFVGWVQDLMQFAFEPHEVLS